MECWQKIQKSLVQRCADLLFITTFNSYGTAIAKMAVLNGENTNPSGMVGIVAVVEVVDVDYMIDLIKMMGGCGDCKAHSRMYILAIKSTNISLFYITIDV